MLTGASVEDDALHSFCNGIWRHGKKTPSRRAHVMRQQLFSPAVRVSVSLRDRVAEIKKGSMERRKNGASLFEETAQAANYDHKCNLIFYLVQMHPTCSC